MSDSSTARIPFYKAVSTGSEHKPWLTMVHGASQHSGLFSAQIDAFMQDYRLLLIDLPGHGQSSSMPGPYGQVEYTTSILAALNDAGVEHTHFWGTHTGAAAGLLLAAMHPARIDSLILEGAVVAGMDAPSIANTIQRAKLTAREQGVAAACAEWFEKANWFAVIRDHPQQCRAEQHRQIIEEFSGAPWTDMLIPHAVPALLEHASILTMPVLLINGEHDLPDFLQMATHLASRLPDVQRVVIPGAGGFPLWEFPQEINAEVHRFLKGLAGNA
jgi:pimeloyl-ACP methyl ester carboxylesterase